MTGPCFKRSSRLLRAYAVFAAFLLLPFPVAAQQRMLSLDDVYDPSRRIDFSGRWHLGLTWIDDSHYLDIDPQSGRSGLVKIEATTGRAEPLFDVNKMEAALEKLPGVTPDEARRQANLLSYTMTPASSAVVLTIGTDIYYYQFGSDHAVRLTFTPEPEEEVSFSPDASMVAFVRSNNLFLIDLVAQREVQLTTDGREDLLYGKLDWLYQEEIVGRGNFRGYWWSPDSSRIAFLQLNEAAVPDYIVEDHIPYRPTVEHWSYPKAGDPNPVAKLGVIRVVGGAPVWVDTSSYAGTEILFVHVDWTPDGKQLSYQIQDREQTWLDLNMASPSTGVGRRLIRETTKAWVNPNGGPTWLKDGSFLWFSEGSGWKHLYQYDADGKVIRTVTSGFWEARTLHGVDETSGWVYFSGTERGPLGLDVYRIKLNGGPLQRLSNRPGTHTALFNPSLTLFTDNWSDIETPPQLKLHRSDGTELRVIDANPVSALSEYRLSKPEFVQVKTRDGFVMEAVMIRPPDFNPSRKYPVYQHLYGGPAPGGQSPLVRNAWDGSTYLYHQLLAQKGIIVWMCDNRSASGKGAQSAWPVYKNLGELELRDIEDGIAWLKELPYVDGSRIGLNGWSFGGFLTSYALTHSRNFAMGIAGGPVTDWRDYDTVYTERYMLMPQHNADGYAKTAPRYAAKDLSGNLLLIHGTMDENVHMQNTLQFSYELQEAGKPFELMLYPKSRHGVVDPELVKHMRRLMLDFTLRNLAPTSPPKSTTITEGR